MRHLKALDFPIAILFLTPSLVMAAEPPAVAIQLHASVVGTYHDNACCAGYDDSFTTTTSSAIAFEDFPNMPETGFLDPAKAFASARDLAVHSETYSNNLKGEGPNADASVNGTRTRILWPNNSGAPPTRVDPFHPFAPPEVLFGVFLPLTLYAKVQGTWGSGLFKATGGSVSISGSATSYTTFTDITPLGISQGRTDSSGSVSFGVSDTGMSSGASGIMSSLKVDSPDSLTRIYNGIVYMPLPVYSLTTNGILQYPAQDYATAFYAAARTDSISGHALAEFEISFSSEPVAMYLPPAIPANDVSVTAANDPIYIPLSELGATVIFMPPLAVPEPSSLALLIFAGPLLVRRRPRLHGSH